MQIGELANRGGVSIQTIRYYERYGLLRQPERKPSKSRRALVVKSAELAKSGSPNWTRRLQS